MEEKLDILTSIRSSPLVNLFIGGVMLISGILISDFPRMVASQSWPTTDGTIVSTRLMGSRFREYDGDYYTHLDAYIRYEYAVDGVSYSSLSINSIDSPFYPEDVADRYPVGMDVYVYYNPNDPAEAVLEPGFVDVLKAIDVFSYLFFAAGFYIIYAGVSKVRQRRRMRPVNNLKIH